MNYLEPYTTSFNKLFYFQYWNFPCFIGRLHSYSCCMAELASAQLDILLPLSPFLCSFWLTVMFFFLLCLACIILSSFHYRAFIILFLLGAITAEYILGVFWSLCFLLAERRLSLLSLAIVRQTPSNINLHNSTAFTGITLLCISRGTALKFKDVSCVTPQEQHHYFLSSV